MVNKILQVSGIYTLPRFSPVCTSRFRLNFRGRLSMDVRTKTVRQDEHVLEPYRTVFKKRRKKGSGFHQSVSAKKGRQ